MYCVRIVRNMCAGRTFSLMKLLAHVAFYDAGEPGRPARPLAGATKASPALSKLKASAQWRSFTFGAVTSLLMEMEMRYVMFEQVLAVIDVNPANTFQQDLLAWTPPAHGSSRRVTVAVHAHHNLSHPFRTTWAHRIHMAANVEEYDWFLYSEADVFVPALAMRTQVELAWALYQRRHTSLGFTRMVNNSKGELFFSDIRQPVKRDSIFTEPGLGTFGSPDNCYAASWAYPREMLKLFMQSNDWLPVLRTSYGMRERAGLGWPSGGGVVRLDDPASLRVFHLGKSGVFYMRHKRGFNTLPANRLVPSRQG